MDTATKLVAFVAAQQPVYQRVLEELTAGRKQSHWIWFIFPQLAGLGSSAMSQRFGIGSAAEARSYLNHPVLGPRLRECTRLVLAHATVDLSSILAYPDDLKFCSCMTLFAAVAHEETLFAEALDAFCGGQRDPRTMAMLPGTPRNEQE